MCLIRAASRILQEDLIWGKGHIFLCTHTFFMIHNCNFSRWKYQVAHFILILFGLVFSFQLTSEETLAFTWEEVYWLYLKLSTFSFSIVTVAKIKIHRKRTKMKLRMLCRLICNIKRVFPIRLLVYTRYRCDLQVLFSEIQNSRWQNRSELQLLSYSSFFEIQNLADLPNQLWWASRLH